MKPKYVGVLPSNRQDRFRERILRFRVNGVPVSLLKHSCNVHILQTSINESLHPHIVLKHSVGKNHAENSFMLLKNFEKRMKYETNNFVLINKGGGKAAGFL